VAWRRVFIFIVPSVAALPFQDWQKSSFV